MALYPEHRRDDEETPEIQTYDTPEDRWEDEDNDSGDDEKVIVETSGATATCPNCDHAAAKHVREGCVDRGGCDCEHSYSDLKNGGVTIPDFISEGEPTADTQTSEIGRPCQHNTFNAGACWACVEEEHREYIIEEELADIDYDVKARVDITVLGGDSTPLRTKGD